MPEHISKREQVDNVIRELKGSVTRNNVDIALPILKWSLGKIQLAYEENIRQKTFKNTNKRSGLPRKVKRGTIYRANLGKNIGSEQNGTVRPVLVIQNESYNTTSTTVLVAPLTDFFNKNGNPKRLMATHVEIENELLDKKSIIKLEHLRSISKNRLTSEVCTIDPEKMAEIENKIKLSFGLN